MCSAWDSQSQPEPPLVDTEYWVEGRGGEGKREREVDWATLPLLTPRVQGQSTRSTPPPAAPGFPRAEPPGCLRRSVIFICEDAPFSLQESTPPKPP